MLCISAKYPHLAMAHLANKYGEIMSLGFGVHFAVVISSHEAMKEIFKRSETYLGRFEFPYVPDRAFNKNLGIVWGHGSSWIEMRKFMTKTLKEFGLGKTRLMESIITRETDEIVENIQKCVDEKEGIVEINSHYFSASMINILWGVVGGFRFDLDDEELAKNIRTNEEVVSIVGHRNIYNSFPILKNWFPKLLQHDRHMQTHRDTQSFMRDMIAKVKTRRSGRTDKEAQNFVESFIDEIEKGSGDPNSHFTEEQLIVVLMDLFLGGSRQTSTVLNWSLLFIVLNPEVQRKVQEEIQSVFQSESQISINDFGRLVYTRATVTEILRHANLVPVPPPRRVESDFVFKDYLIPKGAALFYNLEPVYREESHWGDPDAFRPDRFLNDTNSKLINNERVTPFGFGKRICPAEALAWDCLMMMIATLCRRFTFEPAPGTQPSAKDPNSAVALSPRTFSVKVIPRI